MSTSNPSIATLGRVDNWWYSKVAPAIAISFCSALLYRVAAWDIARSVLLIALVGLCAGSYGHIINDIFDIEVDRNAGKRNHMERFSPPQHLLFCLATLALGFTFSALAAPSPASFLLLAAEFLLPTIYSVPPLRLKSRGVLGLVCDSFGSHMMPCLYVTSIMAFHAPTAALVHTPRSIAFITVTAIWALVLGLTGILIHQFEDRENDLRSNIETFATVRAFAPMRRPIHLFFAVELAAITTMIVLLLPVAPAIAIAAAVFAIALATKLQAQWQNVRPSNPETLFQWWQLTHPFYETYLPLAASIQCAILYPPLAVFPVAQLAAFASSFRLQGLELLAAWHQIASYLIWSGRLHADPHASAWALPIPFPRIGGRIVLPTPGPDAWSVRLARPNLHLRAGTQYRIRFLIRATRPRTITVGLWQDHAPWQSLGYSETLHLTRSFRAVQRTVTATADDPHSYLGFWLGGQPGAIDLWLCTIRAIPAPKLDRVG
jgi:4-hydroxybenzoate polyprenyltransferase